MGFIHEKLSRTFIIKLIITFFVFAIISVFYSLTFSYMTNNAAFEKLSSVSSSLKSDGVPDIVIAKAMTSDRITKDGELILAKLDFTRMDSLPMALRTINVINLTAIMVILCLIVLLITVIFLNKREKVYKEAQRVIGKFNEEDFREHLPSNLDGSLFKLFSSIENLSKTLSAKIDSEKKTKQFLRDMISDISHQIKTPIAAAEIYTDIILEEPENVEAVKNFAVKTKNSMKRIENLVRTILNIARIDTQNVIFTKKDYTISEIITISLEELRTRAEIEGKTIDLSGDTESVLTCDIEWLPQAFSNLIKNSLDHTESGSTIKITASKSPLMTRISVEDNGEGIYPDDIHNVFKRFYRSKHSQNAEGAGLGLPLAKSIIEGQGGVINVESERGSFTKFTVSFVR